MSFLLPLLGHTYSEYSEKICQRLGKGRLHAGLVYEQFYRKGRLCRDHPAFINAQPLVDEIERMTDFLPLQPVKEHHDGDTKKFLLRTANDLEIESVLIPMQAGGTLCVSSQVGCRMGCVFCETGRMGLLKNLTPEEIISQVFVSRHLLGHTVRNVVFMGMGEPLDNYDNVLQAVRILTDPKGFGFGKRHITISTSGCVDGIEKLTREKENMPNLAVSINAPEDKVRTKLMPVNRKHSLEKLHRAMQSYCESTGRQILIAYVLMKGVNDSLEHADKLASYLQGLNVKINIIPYNPQSCSRFAPPEISVLEGFTKKLRDHGYYTLLRLTKGRGIMAACGQLGNLKLRQMLTKPMLGGA